VRTLQSATRYIEGMSMLEPTMTIAGKPETGREAFPVLNPANGQVIGHAPECSADLLDAAVTSAHQAAESWRADPSARSSALLDIAARLERSLGEFAALITEEQGKPLREAREELEAAVGDLRYYAGLSLPVDTVGDTDDLIVQVLRRPMGPVAAITPWNFPVGTAMSKLAPALAAGCTVVLKPSPYTPLSSLRLGELIRDALPPGVLNVVSGNDALGALMTSHPLVRMISFTGSVATGKKIAATAATDLKRILLELGGNDPAIVLDDADVDAVAEGLFANAFANCGQICVAIKRVYAPKSVYGRLVDALADRARAAQLGDGQALGTDIGPLCNPAQRDRINELVSEAVGSGVVVAAGGSTTGGSGYFYQPTVLAGLNGDERIVVEEQFGPALPVIQYSDIEQAVAQANNSHYGLGASVWTADPERGRALAPRVESGTVWVNTHQSGIPGQPFGGLKWSGIGVEGGPWGMLAYTELQAIHTNRMDGTRPL
jgi:acyl-CoA reductase-like NAD-dependent aldehyde dehydrogenase